MSTSSSKQLSPAHQVLLMRGLIVLMLIVGAGLFAYGVTQVRHAKASVDWPSVQGEIIRSAVRVHHDTDSTTYIADIRYRFSVEGKTYTASRVSYGDYSSSSRSHASGVVERYPEGQPVTVYYMPDNPTEALLEPGVTLSTYMLPAIGVAFFAFAVLWLVMKRGGKD